MLSDNSRKAIFLFVCVTIRLTLAFVAWSLEDNKYEWIVSAIFLGASVLMFYKYLMYKNSDSGAFGQKLWWNNERFMHGFMYCFYGILSLAKINGAYLILFADVVLACNSVFLHYNGPVL